MTFNTAYDLLSKDDEIVLYFKERDLYTFIKMYIKIDKLLSVYFKNLIKTENEDDDVIHTISKELLTIKNLLTKNSDNLENLHNNVISSNDALLSNLELYKSEQTNEVVFFKDDLKKELKSLLDNFNNRINNSNNRNVDEISKRSLDIISKLQETLLLSLDSHSINYKIQSIEKVVNMLHTNLSNTQIELESCENIDNEHKYEANRIILLNTLSRSFTDSEVIDVHSEKNAGDIHIIKENHPTILIDSKYENDTISNSSLDRFYTNIRLNNCSGILCNAFGGIANRKHLSIDFVDNNVLVFIHNHKFDNKLFTLATNMIYTIHEQIKDKISDGIPMDNRLFSHLKTEYNVFMQSYECHLDLIQNNLNSLYELKLKSLDHFFKRKSNVTLEVKKFTCHLCSTGCSSEKTLKKHYKEIHQILFNTKYNNFKNMNDIGQKSKQRNTNRKQITDKKDNTKNDTSINSKNNKKVNDDNIKNDNEIKNDDENNEDDDIIEDDDENNDDENNDDEDDDNIEELSKDPLNYEVQSTNESTTLIEF